MLPLRSIFVAIHIMHMQYVYTCTASPIMSRNIQWPAGRSSPVPIVINEFRTNIGTLEGTSNSMQQLAAFAQ